MGPAAIPLMVVGSLMQFGGAMSQAKAVDQQGLNAVAASNYKAEQLRQSGGQQIAASQRERDEEARKGRLMASRALAVAGAGGGGVSDPSVQNMIADLEGESAYRGALKLYQGAEANRQFQQQASTTEFEGMSNYAIAKNKASAIKTKAWSDLAINAGTAAMMGKYGGVGPEQAPAPVEDRFIR